MDLQGSWIFQQDNCAKHTAHVVQEWLPNHSPKVLDHLPQTPDLNPIAHLRELLGRQVRKIMIRNKDMLISVIMKEWQKISPDVAKMLTESISRSLNITIKAKGKSTKYSYNIVKKVHKTKIHTKCRHKCTLYFNA